MRTLAIIALIAAGLLTTPASAAGKTVGLFWEACGDGAFSGGLPPNYMHVPNHRAIAESRGNGCAVSWGFPEVADAEKAAMEACEKRGKHCVVVFSQ